MDPTTLIVVGCAVGATLLTGILPAWVVYHLGTRAARAELALSEALLDAEERYTEILRESIRQGHHATATYLARLRSLDVVSRDGTDLFADALRLLRPTPTPNPPTARSTPGAGTVGTGAPRADGDVGAGHRAEPTEGAIG